MPRVSIGLPVYNGERYIAESVRSVLDQTYDDFELVISDNASTDRTMEILDTFADDPRVIVLRNDVNRGAAWNYNSVFERSTGELFRWHAHDDWFEPSLLDELVAALDAEPDAVLAHSWTMFVDGDGTAIREYHDDLDVTAERPRDRLASTIVHLTFCNAVFGLIRRDVLADTALIAAFPGSDVSLLYELAVRGKFVVVPKLLYNRRPGESIKANRSRRALAEWFDPAGRGKRFPAGHLAVASVRAIWRSPHSTSERASATVAFTTTWPLDYARKVRRRRQRRLAAA